MKSRRNSIESVPFALLKSHADSDTKKVNQIPTKKRENSRKTISWTFFCYDEKIGNEIVCHISTHSSISIKLDTANVRTEFWWKTDHFVLDVLLCREVFILFSNFIIVYLILLILIHLKLLYFFFCCRRLVCCGSTNQHHPTTSITTSQHLKESLIHHMLETECDTNKCVFLEEKHSLTQAEPHRHTFTALSFPSVFIMLNPPVRPRMWTSPMNKTFNDFTAISNMFGFVQLSSAFNILNAAERARHSDRVWISTI